MAVFSNIIENTFNTSKKVATFCEVILLTISAVLLFVFADFLLALSLYIMFFLPFLALSFYVYDNLFKDIYLLAKS